MLKKIISLSVIGLALAACSGDSATVVDEKPAVVTFQFKTESGKSVLTFWRKIEDNGDKGSRFAIGIGQERPIAGYKFPNYEPAGKILDAGTYYLDSYQVPKSTGEFEYCYSEKNTDYRFANGWDSKKSAPYYLSFDVKSGQKLALPVVTFNDSCHMTFKDPNKVFTVGSKVK